MVNYANSKVYRIVSNHTDQVYIGSTTSPLSKRLAEHRSGRNHHLEAGGNYTSSSEIVQFDDAEIILVEEYPCENIEQLRQRERYWIENTEFCVNRKIPGRTQAEWYLDHKAHAIAKSKAHYDVNKAAIRARNTRIFVCECGLSTTYGGRWGHRKSKKHLDALAQLAGQADAEPVAQPEPELVA